MIKPSATLNVRDRRNAGTHFLMVEDDLEPGRVLLQGLKTEAIASQWVRRAADAAESTAFDCTPVSATGLRDSALSKDLQIEVKRYLARIASEPLKLSPREFRLLLELTRVIPTRRTTQPTAAAHLIDRLLGTTEIDDPGGRPCVRQKYASATPQTGGMTSSPCAAGEASP